MNRRIAKKILDYPIHHTPHRILLAARKIHGADDAPNNIVEETLWGSGLAGWGSTQRARRASARRMRQARGLHDRFAPLPF